MTILASFDVPTEKGKILTVEYDDVFGEEFSKKDSLYHSSNLKITITIAEGKKKKKKEVFAFVDKSDLKKVISSIDTLLK